MSQASSSLPVLLKDPRILLLGGGQVALRKARVLADNRVRFSLLARDVLPEISSLALSGAPLIKNIEVTDLEPFNIIVDATGNHEIAELVLTEKQRRFVLVNIVDKPEWCDFYFSALLNYGPLKIAVSTDGASPTIAQTVRDRIRALVPADLGDLVAEKQQERRQGIIDRDDSRRRTLKRLAQVSLIGCGPGDAELLTIQACRCLQEVDVVLYDHLITQQVLDLVPAHVERVFVGKRKSAHSLKQEQINRIILDYARQGLRIARLKSGDPYVFGRGAEEAQFLLNHGVEVRVIPGISSACAAPAAAGIPLTARGYATNVSIVSAHLAESRFNTDWLPLLKIVNHTTVVLMGLSFAGEITARALQEGVAADLPVAIVSNASRPDQRTIVTTLKDLPEQSGKAERPAVLVFGRVVHLHGTLPHFD